MAYNLDGSITLSPLAFKPGNSASDIIGASGGAPSSAVMDLTNPDFLKKLLDTNNLDFLKNYGNTNLPGMASTFAGNYKPPVGSADSAFNDLISRINGPSSVDAVQSGINSQTMQQLLDQISRDTYQAAGTSRMDSADRGLLGPGQTSDIAANALAQIQGQGIQAKANARLGFANSELAIQKAREDAANAAYGTRYAGGLASDTQNRGIYASGAASDAAQLNDLLKTGYSGGLTGGMKFADLASGNTNNYYTNLINSILGATKLGNENTQFYQGLGANANQSALDNALKLQISKIQNQDQPSFLDNLLQTGASSLLGGFTGGAGKIGADMLTSYLTKKKKE